MAISDTYTVMFTHLHGLETLAGDVGHDAAQSLLAASQSRLAEVIDDNDGDLVETIGEEQLALFNTPDAATNAAIQMLPVVENAQPRCFRLSVGVHTGTVFRKPDGDVYGDTVNTASRMKSLAEPGNILATEATVNDMHAQTRSLTRAFDRVKVKGKAEEIKVFRIVWRPDDLNRTRIVPKMIDTGYLKDLAAEKLVLSFAGKSIVVRDSMTPVSVGRGTHCEIQVESPSASRNHARIDHRRGKFVLVDESTNGTHLRRADGSDAILRREEAVLTGRGVFCLGEPASRRSRWLISYEVD